ncbi:MAG TPA: HAMP domain-containing sensor histidine kinase [Ktedonobacteraceae bacterium]|nr:HAMP domain-containing sensor histidine kinase [Ktedonobacteraceae bacterium]
MSAKPKNMPTNMRPTRNISSLYTAWKRHPLSGLRWQLTLVTSLILCIVVILYTVWIANTVEHTSQSGLFANVQVIALILLGVSIIMQFLLINFLLRPLRRMTDVAQAITLGDLQQRERLVPLLEGKDEVNKLAASLNIMVDQLERAKNTQLSSEQRFRRLFSDASHQLRTPLTSLRGFTEILMRGVANEDPETTQRILKMMKNEAERMTHLVNDLLMLSRLDDSRPLETQPVDVVDLAVQSVEQAKLQANDKRKITLHFITQERLDVQANPDRLKQVLFILFDNALKYGRPAPEGWIKLQLDLQEGYALLQIIDNGKGIHPDDLPHVFDRFYRGEHMPIYNTGKAPPSGTGLGLPIALAIVHAHQGDISVISTPDVETVFTVKLPCTKK